MSKKAIKKSERAGSKRARIERNGKEARMWHARRTFMDAPDWLDSEQAIAWAEGWNDCVETYIAQVDAALAKELS